MKNNKNSKYYVPASIQKLFVGVVSPLFIVQFLFYAHQGITQYQHNPHVGGFYGFFFTQMFVPILLYSISYALNPRSLNFVARSFESIVITLSGMIAWSLLSMISPAIFLEQGAQYIESYARYEIIASSVLVLLYGLVLYWLRLTKRWQ